MINYEGSYDQEAFPHSRCRSTGWTFGYDRGRDLIDKTSILLSAKVDIYKGDCEFPAKVKEHPIVLSTSTLRVLFPHAELFLNGKFISQGNNCHLLSLQLSSVLGILLLGKNKKKRKKIPKKSL